MCAEKCDSMIIKETLKSLCCNNGWCYGVFWGFDQSKTLLLTLKDAYYEEQIGALINSLLPQVHVLGGGVIGQVAFTHNHQWMHSNTHNESRNSLAPFENFVVFQDDSEFYSQFCLGIKTIALISVEPWGVVQFGSTHKNPETKDFVDEVKKLFREVRFLENELPLDSRILNSSTQFSPLLSCDWNQNLKIGADSEGFMEPNHSLLLPSQSFPSTSNHRIENPIQISSRSTNQVEDYLRNASDCSVLTSSWPHSTSGLEENVASQDLYKDMFNTQNFTSLICKAQRPSGLLTMEELFQENDFAKSVSDPGLLDDDFSRWFSPQPGPNSTTSFTTLLRTDLSHSTGLVPLSSLSGNNSPIHTNSIQSSVTDALRSNPEVKYSGTSGTDKLFSTLGCKKPLAWDETLIPVSTDKYVGSSKTRTSSSLFSKLGLDQFLDAGVAGTSSCSFEKSGLEDPWSNAAKRRKTDRFSSGLNQVRNEGLFSFDRKMKSLNPVFDPEAKNIGLRSEAGSCIMEAGYTSSSERLDEPAKTAKKKAKPGTKPRPKDRQMIQDRLSELRELIPNGEKMSIDRLLERTIRHLNFMRSLIKHAESLKQIDKPKKGEVPKNNSSKDGGGVTWACEVGDRSMVCPLIVEDLVTAGQMLIEILCEEQGFFLEIADVIRGFGLIILKGAMEVRETKKIWVHFLVQAEGTRRVTRHEIFSSLIQLLQMTGQSASANASDSFGAPSFNKCQPAVSFPVNLSDVLPCANL